MDINLKKSTFKNCKQKEKRNQLDLSKKCHRDLKKVGAIKKVGSDLEKAPMTLTLKSVLSLKSDPALKAYLSIKKPPKPLISHTSPLNSPYIKSLAFISFYKK